MQIGAELNDANDDANDDHGDATSLHRKRRPRHVTEPVTRNGIAVRTTHQPPGKPWNLPAVSAATQGKFQRLTMATYRIMATATDG